MADCGPAAISCGVAEVVHLSLNPKEVLKDVIHDYTFEAYDRERKSGWAFLTWSDIADPTSPGQRFARLLRRLFPRSVTATEARRNPNTGNYIKVWVWSVPQARFQEYIAKNYPEMVEDADSYSRVSSYF